MAGLQHDFGRGVTERPSHRREHIRGAGKHLRDAKVGEHEWRVGRRCEIEEVFRLEVPVHDVVAVKVGDGRQHLQDHARGVTLSEFPVFADAVEELAAGGELCDDVVFVLWIVDVSFLGGGLYWWGN